MTKKLTIYATLLLPIQSVLAQPIAQDLNSQEAVEDYLNRRNVYEKSEQMLRDQQENDRYIHQLQQQTNDRLQRELERIEFEERLKKMD